MKGKERTPWVVAGGKIGEIVHCTRCGRGLDLGGPQALPVVVAAMNAFVKIHKHCREGMHVEPETNTPEQWLRGRDTGISSCTIYAVMMNQRSPMREYNVPHDPDDFGRCYRLLKLFPSWVVRLPEVAQRFPQWVPFVENWGKLTEMFERKLAKQDDTPAMYNFMRTLEGRDPL